MDPSEIFYSQIREAWGSPHRVADVAFSELFRHDGIGLDYDDQVEYALKVGVIAGLMKDRTPDEFAAAFIEKVLDQS